VFHLTIYERTSKAKRVGMLKMQAEQLTVVKMNALKACLYQTTIRQVTFFEGAINEFAVLDLNQRKIDSAKAASFVSRFFLKFF
jgi:hypothetical protein